MSRLDTKLESEGAEFLVLGNLLLRGVSAYKSYQNFKGYDLVAINAEYNSTARIQVKSRYQSNWDGFIINNYDCDFVVLVTLNRGFKKTKKNGDNGIKDPEYYIFPVDYINKIKDPENKWGKIVKSKMVEYITFKDKWEYIENFLKVSRT